MWPVAVYFDRRRAGTFDVSAGLWRQGRGIAKTYIIAAQRSARSTHRRTTRIIARRLSISPPRVPPGLVGGQARLGSGVSAAIARDDATAAART